MTYDELAAYCKEANNEIIRQDEQIRKLEKENQELKKKYENAVADYETTMSERNELKRQLEEINKMIEKCGFVNIEQVMLNYCGLLTQQKEFIEWLENESKEIYRDGGLRQNIFKQVLQKYQEIIGVSDENNIK